MRAELVDNDYYPPTKLVGYFSRLIKTRTPKGKLIVRVLMGLLGFGFLAFIPLIIIGYFTDSYLFESWEMILAFCWFMVAPVLIDLFEYSVDDFWIKFEKIAVLNKSEFEDLKKRMNAKIFSKKYLFLSVCAYVPMIFVLFFTLHNYDQLVLICVYCLMIVAAIMWGIVVYLSFYINSFVREIVKIKVKINPFDTDGFGGLSAIGVLTLRIATLLSLASLYIPSAFESISQSEIIYLNYLLYAGVACVIGGVIFTFVSPLIPVSQLAREVKDDMMRIVGDKLTRRLDRFEKETTDMREDIQTLVVFENYREIRNMRIWPFDVASIINIGGMIILPIATFLLSILL